MYSKQGIISEHQNTSKNLFEEWYEIISLSIVHYVVNVAVC